MHGSLISSREETRQTETALDVPRFSGAEEAPIQLDNGMPPIRLLRELLLKDKNSWDKIL